MISKPYGHTAIAICDRPKSAKLAKGTVVLADNGATRLVRLRIHARGGIAQLNSAAKRLRGILRLEQVEAYSRDEWVRAFGKGSEHGTRLGARGPCS